MSVSEVVLPREKVKAESISPKRLVIYSKPKVGKTTALSLLDNCLILDFEKGSGFLDAMKLKVDSISRLKEIGAQIIKEGRPYKYIAIDTATALEDMCMPLAIQLFQETPMGKGFSGKNILTLPNGSGYLYYRMAMDRVLEYIDTLADRIIILGHMKDKILPMPDGKEVVSSEIDLTGKIKTTVCAKSDAIAVMIKRDNKVFLSFVTSETIVCGARPKHLRNKEILITEEDETGTIKSYWDKVYVD